VYYLGIRNDYDREIFYVHSECDLVEADNVEVCNDDNGVSCDEYNDWIMDRPIGPVNISKNNRKIVDIFVAVPKKAARGTYVYDVSVCYDNPCTETYLTPQKLSVIVRN